MGPTGINFHLMIGKLLLDNDLHTEYKIFNGGNVGERCRQIDTPCSHSEVKKEKETASLTLVREKRRMSVIGQVSLLAPQTV